ncbi:MAG: carboxypeptidase-like regulatory domain-containing protein [Acidobacteriia bacterium]|nr:carboxypeptidase-like regulatory domain-containing protein [Terriglobia bacterium]
MGGLVFSPGIGYLCLKVRFMTVIRIAALVAAGLLAWAQEPSGQILGRVTDASGSVVVGARVRAVRAVSSATAADATGLTGEYALRGLLPGSYAVSIEMPGFRSFVQKRVLVHAGAEATVDARLEVGPARESVRVVEETPLLDMASGGSGILIDAEKLLELPFRNGNPMGLALLAPGVLNLAEGGTTRAYDNENLSALSVHGSGPGSHEFSLDGAVNTGGMSGNVAHVPPAAAVAEFRINTSSFDVGRGFSMGSHVNLSLRSGGSRLHGQLSYSVENPVANANSFFSNRSKSGKDNFRANHWTAYASGPVPSLPGRKKRTFWMYAYEGIHAAQPYRNNSLSYTVPTPSERQGNFADLLPFGSQYKIYDPLTTVPASTPGRYTRTVFPGNIIPPSRLSQAAANILAEYYPLPNVPGAKPTGVNFVMPSLVANRFQNHVARLDHQLGARDRLTLRASSSDRGQDIERRFNGGAGSSGERENRGFGVDSVVALSPRVALNLRYNYTRYVDDYAPPSAGLDLTSLGFSHKYADQLRAVDPRNLMLPDITPTGYPELNGQAMTRSASDIYSVGGDLARSRGSHSLRFGVEHRLYRDTSGNTGRSSGKLDFSTNWTRGPLDNSAAAPAGQGLASFLLGLPTGAWT